MSTLSSLVLTSSSTVTLDLIEQIKPKKMTRLRLPMDPMTCDIEAGPLRLPPGAGAASTFFSGASFFLLIVRSSLRLFFIYLTVDRIGLEELFVSSLACDHAAVHDYDHVAFLNGSDSLGDYDAASARHLASQHARHLAVLLTSLARSSLSNSVII